MKIIKKPPLPLRERAGARGGIAKILAFVAILTPQFVEATQIPDVIQAGDRLNLTAGTTTITKPITLRGWISIEGLTDAWDDFTGIPPAFDLTHPDAKIFVERWGVEQGTESLVASLTAGIHKSIVLNGPADRVVFRKSSEILTDSIDFHLDYGSVPIESSKCGMHFETTSGNVTYNSIGKFYETSGSDFISGKLSFSRKYRVKITVKPNSILEKLGSNTASSVYSGGGMWRGIMASGDKLYAMECNSGSLAICDTSASQVAWTTLSVNKGDDISGGWWNALCSIGNKLYAIEEDHGQLITCDLLDNPVRWAPLGTNKAENAIGGFRRNICAIGDNLYSIEYYSGQLVTYDTSAQSDNIWKTIGTSCGGNRQALCSIGSLLYTISIGSGSLTTCNPSAQTVEWAPLGSNAAGNIRSGSWCGMCSAGDVLYAIEESSGQIAKINVSQQNPIWTAVDANVATAYNGLWHTICSNGNMLYAMDHDSGQLVGYSLASSDHNVFEFTNISDSTSYGITGLSEFVIEPSQMTANEITFNMKNIQFVSAEISSGGAELAAKDFDQSTAGTVVLEMEHGDQNRLADMMRLELNSGSVSQKFVCDTTDSGKTPIEVRANLTAATPVALEGDWTRYKSGSFETTRTGTLRIEKAESMPQSNITIGTGGVLEFTGSDLDYTTGAGTILDLRRCSKVSGGKSLTIGAGGKIIF